MTHAELLALADLLNNVNNGLASGFNGSVTAAIARATVRVGESEVSCVWDESGNSVMERVL
jgi:hypothetical protein